MGSAFEIRSSRWTNQLSAVLACLVFAIIFSLALDAPIWVVGLFIALALICSFYPFVVVDPEREQVIYLQHLFGLIPVYRRRFHFQEVTHIRVKKYEDQPPPYTETTTWQIKLVTTSGREVLVGCFSDPESATETAQTIGDALACDVRIA